MIKIIAVAVLLNFYMSSIYAETKRSLKLKGMEPDIPEYIEPYEGDIMPYPEKQKKVLPHVPEDIKKQNLSSVSKIFIKKIKIEGNTLLPENMLSAITALYENRNVSPEEIHKLRNELSLLYYRQGYINSGVILPDQKINNGVIVFKVIQGRLTGVSVSGNKSLNDDYLTERLALFQSEFLSLTELQTGLQVLQQYPLINRINAKLKPGAALGEAELNINVSENTPYQIALAYDNHRAPSVGAERASLVMFHRSITGRSDMLSAEIGNTDGLSDVTVAYSLPLTRHDTMFDVTYASSDSIVVEEPFNVIDIKNKSESTSIGLSHPFVKKLNRELIGRFILEKKQSQSSILGVPFSFSPGVIDGKSSVAIASLGVDWIKRSQQQVLVLGVQFRNGLDAFSSTINENLPDSKFTTINGQLQYARRVDWLSGQVVLKSGFQLSQDSLLPDVKYAIGGSQTVRGYRENQYVRDSGTLLSIEYRVPILVDENGRNRYGLQLIPFIDYGAGWDEDDSLPTSSKSKLMSIGIGVIWEPIKQFHAELYWASRLEDVPNPKTDLQDDGIHFLFRYEFVR